MPVNAPSGTRLDELVGLSRSLGRPERDLVILGEGNTSVRLDDETFLVKASGTSLAEAREGSFVRMDLGRTLALLDLVDPSDGELGEALMAARSEGEGDLRPSIEAVMHALCLTEGEATFVGHTHPTAVNAVLCSDRAGSLSEGAIFPDQVVVLGRHPLYLPYVDVGLPLAHALLDALRAHRRRVGAAPKTIYLQNHGLVALGQSAGGVEQVTTMAAKHARIMSGVLAAGEPVYLTAGQADSLDARPDEEYRRRVIQGDR
ncbi:class II aldolase [Rubrobacter tropicus]|uniref:Class II aldolase n=1 Tax=Rubrobacter tropicus TaxID=2653851 RepID=A0A6G8QES7_9ACTN|nr:class II aldolase/adducin family protein [Rubrobacter tropicus]QIN84989.1 class II aldolase [Rubrobacter tropicus]